MDNDCQIVIKQMVGLKESKRLVPDHLSKIIACVSANYVEMDDIKLYISK